MRELNKNIFNVRISIMKTIHQVSKREETKNTIITIDHLSLKV